MFILQIWASLNTQNNPYTIDVVQKIGTAIDFAIGSLKTWIEHKKLNSRYLIGNVENIDATYTVIRNVAIFKVQIIHMGDYYNITFGCKELGGRYPLSSAQKAIAKFKTTKRRITLICSNLLDQIEIDKKLMELADDDKFFNALLTCVSMGCLQISAKFERISILEHMKKIYHIPSRSDHYQALELVLLKSEDCRCGNPEFADISILPQTSTFQNQINFAEQCNNQMPALLTMNFNNDSEVYAELISLEKAITVSRFFDICQKATAAKQKFNVTENAVETISAITGLLGYAVEAESVSYI
uniref:Uncharacterized protein n=1 Tax=Panagrolaimus sp. PS1159 TaxID=55785 RepID=A0AC35GAB7_9BILA